MKGGTKHSHPTPAPRDEDGNGKRHDPPGSKQLIPGRAAQAGVYLKGYVDERLDYLNGKMNILREDVKDVKRLLNTIVNFLQRSADGPVPELQAFDIKDSGMRDYDEKQLAEGEQAFSAIVFSRFSWVSSPVPCLSR